LALLCFFEKNGLELGLALLAIPAALSRLDGKADTGEVEPLVGAQFVIARNHVSVAHVVAETVRRLSVASSASCSVTLTAERGSTYAAHPELCTA